ncbi:MAG TPA: chemotaxis protein CheA, partial [Verrucomicrobiae bacterium]
APAAAPPAKSAEAPVATVAAPANAASAMVKVDTAKLDGLLDLVGELVIAQSLVAQNLQEIAGVGQQFTRNMAQMGRITRELQRVGMSLRMVPIRGVFQKMARVARDLSVKQQKKVQFLTVGEETELDRGVVEELNDPLLHMIRNSMDHGIEPPNVRLAQGKPPVGTLQLRAYHQGGNIVVEIQDDGAGLNKDRILKKAIERGLVSPNATPTDQEIYAFVFAAGFSTAEKVTDLSGRGVGLDVVRRNIEHLRGRVDISSTPGKGTQFKLTLPLTLAIIDGLIIKVGEERFILPTLSVCESFRPQPEMISRVQGRAEVVNVRGAPHPAAAALRIPGHQPEVHRPDGIARGGGAIRHEPPLPARGRAPAQAGSRDQEPQRHDDPQEPRAGRGDNLGRRTRGADPGCQQPHSPGGAGLRQGGVAPRVARLVRLCCGSESRLQTEILHMEQSLKPSGVGVGSAGLRFPQVFSPAADTVNSAEPRSVDSGRCRWPVIVLVRLDRAATAPRRPALTCEMLCPLKRKNAPTGEPISSPANT